MGLFSRKKMEPAKVKEQPQTVYELNGYDAQEVLNILTLCNKYELQAKEQMPEFTLGNPVKVEVQKGRKENQLLINTYEPMEGIDILDMSGGFSIIFDGKDIKRINASYRKHGMSMGYYYEATATELKKVWKA